MLLQPIVGELLLFLSRRSPLCLAILSFHMLVSVFQQTAISIVFSEHNRARDSLLLLAVHVLMSI
jgi:hypothetical protein